MDLELTSTPTTKSPDDTEIDTPPHIHNQTINSLSYANGATKNHHHFHHQQPPPPPLVFTFKECMKNHAATIGGHAVDGCGEFMPSPSTNPTDPTSLKCAACGCHRNFHRREHDFPTAAAMTPPFLDFRHPPPRKRSSLSPSPPPPPHPYAPTMLLALSTAVAAEDHHQAPMTPTAENPAGRKRFRTKFSQEQKEKMHSFSEKLGWKMHKSDDAAVEEFCRRVGVAKGVLKVWMHNNKNTIGRKEIANGRTISFENIKNHEEGKKNGNGSPFQNGNGGGIPFHSSNNGSSSST